MTESGDESGLDEALGDDGFVLQEGTSSEDADGNKIEVESSDSHISTIPLKPEGLSAARTAESTSNLSALRGGIVTARGTGSGLVIRLDGRVSQDDLLQALKVFVDSRRSFLSGNEVSLEWVGAVPGQRFVAEVIDELNSGFGIKVKGSALREKRKLVDRIETSKVSDVRSNDSNLSLFGGMEGFDFEEGESDEEDSKLEDNFPMDRGASEKAGALAESGIWDDPDARIVYQTLRGGQKIETEHTLIVVGDVNSGAEIVAGGDIVVLGTLRGVAHAGAYDETGGGRFIFALNLRPTQLRIGMVISRGSAEEGKAGAEIARVDGNLIVVEPYQARSALSRIQP